jgi:hypothetical protein
MSEHKQNKCKWENDFPLPSFVILNLVQGPSRVHARSIQNQTGVAAFPL